MKKEIILFGILLFSICSAAQQANENKKAKKYVRADSIAQLVLIIREAVNKINHAGARLTMVKTDIEGRSTEGGEAKKFYKGSVLCKAVITIYGEMGQSSAEYYFTNGRLSFLYQRNQLYNKPMYLKGSKTTRIEQSRYYFSKARLIKWLNEKEEITDKTRCIEKQKEIINDVKELILE